MKVKADRVIHTDNSEVIANMQAEIRHLEALVETQKTIIDYNAKQLSVITEQLDAAHVFCEEVKEYYIKVVEEVYNKMLHNGVILITKPQFIEYFKNMQGLEEIAVLPENREQK